ncbi:amino acid permease/ SLC12A domain-containing protein [Hypoxylon fragiforme]|uniref:amino acid permease/ SLC12A domain-containing protein n=1 Tax=Hypoxylon fragiforme TaxID=63214 RepID=UPI0020C6DF55|nr:amino acid permease/ SLC12A domain-containing protein [Hypoxylon fragiforme]KAI2610078.1 amino acid permease/ SLC12A domain-containing protein [Hypoxylon fragiforme]
MGTMEDIDDKSSTSHISQDDISVGTGECIDDNAANDGLQRGLKSRHLQMLAFSSVVGASVFNGTGAALASSGPLGALLSFLLIGIDVFFVSQSLAEMCALFPGVRGAFLSLAARFVDPALAFALGTTYYALWVSSIAHDYNSLARAVGRWTSPAVPPWAWVLVFWALFQGVSVLGAAVYGDIMLVLTSWKLLCVAGGFVLAILLNTGAISSSGEYLGFRYWRDPGAVTNGVGGFASSLVLAAVYFGGTEMVALTAAESRDPHRDVPRAIRRSFWRIAATFVGLVFFAGIIVPFDDAGLLAETSDKAARSPWTIALVQAGWADASNLLNAVMIVAALSSVNSAIYVSSRVLASLAAGGRAPALFARTTAGGVPLNAVLLSNAFGLVALVNNCSTAAAEEEPGQVFGFLINFCDTAAFITWAAIGVMHLRLRRAWTVQGRSAEELPYRAFLYPYGAWFVVALNLFLVLISGYDAFSGSFDIVGFLDSYAVVLVFVILFFGWRVYKRTSIVPLAEADLATGRDVFMIKEKMEDTVSDKKANRISWHNQLKRAAFG